MDWIGLIIMGGVGCLYAHHAHKDKLLLVIANMWFIGAIIYGALT